MNAADDLTREAFDELVVTHVKETPTKEAIGNLTLTAAMVLAGVIEGLPPPALMGLGSTSRDTLKGQGLIDTTTIPWRVTGAGHHVGKVVAKIVRRHIRDQKR